MNESVENITFYKPGHLNVQAIFLADSGVGAVIEIHQSDVIVIVPTVSDLSKEK